MLWLQRAGVLKPIAKFSWATFSNLILPTFVSYMTSLYLQLEPFRQFRLRFHQLQSEASQPVTSKTCNRAFYISNLPILCSHLCIWKMSSHSFLCSITIKASGRHLYFRIFYLGANFIHIAEIGPYVACNKQSLIPFDGRDLFELTTHIHFLWYHLKAAALATFKYSIHDYLPK